MSLGRAGTVIRALLPWGALASLPIPCRPPATGGSPRRHWPQPVARQRESEGVEHGQAATVPVVASPADSRRLLGDGIEGGARLSYPEAALAFLQWLQARGTVGETGAARLLLLYGQHCTELGLAWLPENMLFGEFKKLASRHERRVPRRDGRRERETTYDIPRRSAQQCVRAA